MMRSWMTAGLVLVAALSAAACGDDDDDGAGSVAELEREINDWAKEVCECWPAASEAECRAQVATENINSCEKAVYSKPEARATVQCVLAAVREVRSCTRATMCNLEALDGCTFDAFERCELPAELAAEVEACPPPTGFVRCPNGDLIEQDYVCDQFDDCEDGWDEADC